MLKRFLDISPALVGINYGRLYEAAKGDPSLIDAVNQENYSKQAASLVDFILSSVMLEMSQVERIPTIEGHIRRYNERLLDIDYFYKTDIQPVGLKEAFDKKQLAKLRYDTGPLFALVPAGKYFQPVFEQYQKRILKVYLAGKLFESIRIELNETFKDAEDPRELMLRFEAVTHAIEEFELYMWKRSLECVECKVSNVTHVESGTNNYYCEKCAASFLL